jgi:hypothetical protein
MKENEKSTGFACREFKGRKNVFLDQIGKVMQQFHLCGPTGEIFQNVRDGDARAFDAWLAASDIWINRDTLEQL